MDLLHKSTWTILVIGLKGRKSILKAYVSVEIYVYFRQILSSNI